MHPLLGSFRHPNIGAGLALLGAFFEPSMAKITAGAWLELNE